MADTTRQDAPAHEVADIDTHAICDYCHGDFKPKRKWQKFCTEPCRRAFEKIIQRFSTRLHGLIRDSLKELDAARNMKGDI